MALKYIQVCAECELQWDVSSLAPGKTFVCRCGSKNTVVRSRSHPPSFSFCETCGFQRAASRAPCEWCGAMPTLEASRATWVCPFCSCRTSEEGEFCQSCGRELAPLILEPGSV